MQKIPVWGSCSVTQRVKEPSLLPWRQDSIPRPAQWVKDPGCCSCGIGLSYGSDSIPGSKNFLCFGGSQKISCLGNVVQGKNSKWPQSMLLNEHACYLGCIKPQLRAQAKKRSLNRNKLPLGRTVFFDLS